LKFLILFSIFIFSCDVFSDNFKLKIDHHGNIINPVGFDKNINFRADNFDEDLKFESDLLKQHLKHISKIIPINSYIVLYGNRDGYINEIDKTYHMNKISLSHTGLDHVHDPEIFFDDDIEIDISPNKDQNSIYILQKRKKALLPILKLTKN